MKKIKGLFQLLRFELPFSAGVCVVMGQILALGKFASIIITVLGFLSVFLISASILVLNDYFDIETDKINAPDRPIPSNLVSPSEALALSVVLLFVGLLISVLISISALLISIVLAIIGFLYNRYFKKTGFLGNLMVSFSVGMTFIYGGITVNLPQSNIVILFALIAALIDLGEEIASDSMDIKGDLLIKSKSLAIRYGKSVAINTSISIFFLVILISLIPFILNWISNYYIIPIVVMDFIIAHSAFKIFNSKNEDGRKYIRRVYLGGTFGLILFLIMRLIEI